MQTVIKTHSLVFLDVQEDAKIRNRCIVVDNRVVAHLGQL